MKNTKKLLAALLAVILMLSMSAFAFADDIAADPNVEDAEPLTGRSFTAYQIFSATSYDAESKQLVNLAWGDGITEAGRQALATLVGADSTDAVAVAEKITTANAKEVAKEAFKYITGTGTAVTSGDTKLPAGYYIVADTSTDAAINADEQNVRNLSILRVSNPEAPVVIYSKVSVPTVDKEILDPDPATAVKANEAGMGEVVNYKIVGTMPSNLDDYYQYYYKFADTMSKGLTYNKDMKVMVGTTDITDLCTITSSVDAESKITTINVSINDVKILKNADGTALITKDSEVVLTYSATVNEDALIVMPNEVKLIYTNDPNYNSGGKPHDEDENHPTGETPKSTVKTFTTQLTIQKVDNFGRTLKGAEFQLTGATFSTKIIKATVFVEDAAGEYWKLVNGTYTTTAPILKDYTDENNITHKNNAADYASTTQKYSVQTTTEVVEGNLNDPETDIKAFVGEDGKVTFFGLGAGKYTLEETETPSGFNTIDPIEFTVTFSYSATEDEGTFTATDPITVDGTTNFLYTEIVNESGIVLPETGGMGTTLFYIIGGIFVLGAGILLVAKKRMEN